MDLGKGGGHLINKSWEGGEQQIDVDVLVHRGKKENEREVGV